MSNFTAEYEATLEKANKAIAACKKYGEGAVTMPPKIKIERIEIHWAEGRQSDIPSSDASVIDVETWSFRRALEVAQQDGGYDKVKYTVHYADGETYNGRADLGKNGRSILSEMNGYIDYLETQEEDKAAAQDWRKVYSMGVC